MRPYSRFVSEVFILGAKFFILGTKCVNGVRFHLASCQATGKQGKVPKNWVTKKFLSSCQETGKQEKVLAGLNNDGNRQRTE
tara:strand:- start:81 stop:326 length:246 start_codon:yes stop_codon:yes gene_type:complete